MAKTLNLISVDQIVKIPANIPFDFTIVDLDGSTFNYSATIEETVDTLSLTNDGLYISGPYNAISTIVVDGYTYDFNDDPTLTSVVFVSVNKDDVVAEVDMSIAELILHMEGEF